MNAWKIPRRHGPMGMAVTTPSISGIRTPDALPENVIAVDTAGTGPVVTVDRLRKPTTRLPV